MSFTQLLLAGGTALSISSQLRQGQQQQGLYEYNAAVNRQKAQLFRQAGDLQISRMRREKVSFGKKQTALYAKAGIADTGSPLQVKADTAAELEFDIMIEDFNTRIAVINANSEAELDVMRGQAARQASRVNAGTTLLTQLPNFVGSGNLGKIKGGTNIGGGYTSFGIPVSSRIAY